MIKITIINSILELLTEKELTSLEISANLGIAKDILYPKLNRLVKEHRIIRVNEKKPYKYKAINPKALLKQLHSIMMKRMDFIEKPSENEILTIKTIEKVIK
ncbi:MAG: hypothetical protein ACTSXH_12240 [Promethearchaeota archaeon]